MFVSIIIPTYRRPQLLLTCLENLCQQAFPVIGYEIIVVTDGPDAVTKDAVVTYQQQHQVVNIQCISLTKKGGPAAARNAGWKTAKGELILFTDDDCLPDKNWVAAYKNAYVNAGKNEIAFTGKTIVPQPVIPTDFEKNTTGLESAEFITANCACSKAALQQTGGFDEQFTMAWREDSDLHFRFLEVGIPLLKIEKAIIVHPVRAAPWGISIREQKKGLFNALLYKNHPHLYKEKIGTNPIWNYYAMIVAAVTSLVFLIIQLWLPAFITIALWLFLVLQFAYKRLKGTSKKGSHILEMMYTSAIIPFLSVYWTLYGAIRYKKFLL